LCKMLHLEGLADHPDYATGEARYRNRPALSALLAPIFAAETSAVLLEKLEAHSVPAGPIYKMDEVFADPQVQHLGIAQKVVHPERGEIALVGQPFTLSRTPSAVVTPLPDKGAHSDAILTEAGLSPDEIAVLHAGGVV